MNRRLGNIELLRGLAASWVVLTHAGGWLVAKGLSPMGDIFYSWGSTGVDLFFVISGFVISKSYFQKPASFGSFVKARVVRILPAYWIVTISTAAVAALALQLNFQQSAFEGLSLSWFLSSLLFISQPLGFGSPLVYQGWTLEVEMAFYAIFAVGILVFKRSGQLKLFVPLAIALLVILGEALPAVALEFCLGMLIAVAVENVKSWKTTRFLQSVLLPLGVTSLVLALIFELQLESRWVFLGVPSMLIVWGLAILPQFQSQAARSFGSASYAIYLWQVLTIPIFLTGMFSLSGNLWPEVYVLSALLVTLITGWVFDRFIDSPMRTKISSIGAWSRVNKDNPGLKI